MREVHQLIMIIPAVLNLKGNLEMNLSARLSTAANVGELEPPVRWSIIKGNLSLLQVQAAVVSFIVACISSALALILTRIFSSSSHTAAELLSSTGKNVTSPAILTLRRPSPLPSLDVHIDHGFYTFAFSSALLLLLT
jgi:solute carrier family 41